MMLRRRLLFVSVPAMLLLAATLAHAQLFFSIVYDAKLWAKNAVIAALKQQLLDTLNDERDRLRQMAKRLSAYTDLGKYAITDDDTPMWRIHVFWGNDFLFANPYHAALNYGDGAGTAYTQIARPRTAPGEELALLGETAPDAAAAIGAELATLDAADSTLIAGTDQTGQLRYNGRRELAAIEALQDDALDPSLTQSATAVLEKISGAGLIRSRQQQARMQFLAAIVEQLLVDNKRARDTEAAAMNMQLERLRAGRAANSSLIAGSADDLHDWRQP